MKSRQNLMQRWYLKSLELWLYVELWMFNSTTLLIHKTENSGLFAKIQSLLQVRISVTIGAFISLMWHLFIKFSVGLIKFSNTCMMAYLIIQILLNSVMWKVVFDFHVLGAFKFIYWIWLIFVLGELAFGWWAEFEVNWLWSLFPTQGACQM